MQTGLGSLGSIAQRLFPCQTALLLKTDGDDIAQEGQTLGMELITLCGIVQFGAQARNDIAVGGILCAVGNDQSMGIALL